MVTLALIGVGKWGRKYLDAAKHLTGCRIKYICATHQESFAALPSRYHRVTDYRDIIAQKDVDGVIIATPASTHARIASFFLSHKHSLLIEKPLTTNLADAQRLIAYAKKCSAKVMVGHIYLFHPGLRYLISLLPSIGTLTMIDITDGNYGPFRTDVSALWDWAPHAVSLALWIIGATPKHVRAWGGAEIIYGQLQFSHLPVYFKIGRRFFKKERRVLFIGTKGMLVFDDTLPEKIFFMEKLVSLPPSVISQEPLVAQLQSFITYIQTGKAPVSNLDFALRVTTVIDRIEQSLAHNGVSINI